MSTMTQPLRVGVVGCGRMGRHHVRVASQAEGAELVAIADASEERRTTLAEQFGGAPCANLDELLRIGVDAIVVATPTVTHRDIVLRAAAAGVHCLVEKPLAPDERTATEMAGAADRAGVALQVGHVVRYDPVMVAVRGLADITPRFIEMDRISPMTFRSVDVGVVLDMMIHDLDLLLMLVGSEPEEIHANAVCVLGEAEDICNARLVFPAGRDGIRCVANVTASRMALKTERKIRIISEDAYVSADFVARQGTVVRKTANAEQLETVRRQLKDGDDLSGVNYLDLVKVEPLAVGAGDPLTLQFADFVKAVRTGQRPFVDAEAGSAAVRTAERIVEAARAAGARMV
ncbi:MAG: hypothetical protein RL461_467 [Planctomycetota bacterium]|jgi:predicted dehydrogenase